MKHMGSKSRIAKYILLIMLCERKIDQWWVEPFVGGANIIDKVSGKRIGNDANKDCIDALKLICDNLHLIPKSNKDFTEQDYKNRCKNKPLLKGFTSFAYSYGAKHWGGWSRDKNKRDYVAEAYINDLKQNKNLQGIIFTNKNFYEMKIPPNSLIYCDPPYEGMTKYKNVNFNHEDFWQWCRNKKTEGHTVFISEYHAPNDFECIWSKEVVSNLAKNTKNKKRIEKLFKI